MTQFPFTRPPKSPGVYAIRHLPTGKLYIGSSKNLAERYREWTSIINSGAYHKGAIFRDELEQADPADFVFEVLAEREDYVEVEKALISAALKRDPGRLINLKAPATKGVATVPESTVLSADGRRLSYDQAAEYLGIPKIKLLKRLARYRAKGEKVVSVVTLQERTGGRPKKAS
jgi:hypothetical protein